MSEFARDQLLKHGWEQGKGLGRKESGIKEAIKVQIKNDTAGVGHDPGQDFTFHWWDHVFNKAASNINVKTTEDGVSVTSGNNNGPISNKKPTGSKTLDNKSLLYGRFVKAATLTHEEGLAKEAKIASSSESEDEDDYIKTTKMSDEDVFKVCGGRTAHKGARHGMKCNGKLLRIQEQDRLHSEPEHKIKKQKKKSNDQDVTLTEPDPDIMNSKKHKKKKRRDKKLKNELKDQCIDRIELENKPRKKKKRKFEQTESAENSIHNDVSDKISNKESKKRRGKKVKILKIH